MPSRTIAQLPPWRWGARRFFGYGLAALTVASLADQLAEFSPAEAIPVTAAIYVLPVIAIAWAGRLRAGRGKGRPQ